MYEPDFKTNFIDGTGKKVDGALVSSPLLVRNADDSATFLGSTFFIARNGLMLTAKHCLLNKNIYIKNLFIVQIIPDNIYVIRPIMRTYCNDSDVAVLVPIGMTSKSTGKQLRNPVLPITNFKVGIGERIASFAWPSTRTYLGENGMKVSMAEKWHYGLIEDYHDNGTTFLKYPCYQSCMHIEGGSSGGPVANSSGHVFAINSTGADVSFGLEPYSMLSPIEHCFSIKIETEGGKWYTIKELIKLNQILFSGTFNPELKRYSP